MINPVYLRMFIYAIAPMVAMLPGITYDSVAQTLLLDLETFAIGLATGFAAIGVVFGAWGKK